MKKLLGFVDIPVSLLVTYGIYLLTSGDIDIIKSISTYIYLFIQIMFGIIMFKMLRKEKLNTLDKIVYHQQKIARPLDSVVDKETAVKELHNTLKKGGKIMINLKKIYEKYAGYVFAALVLVTSFLNEHFSFITNLFPVDQRVEVGKYITIGLAILSVIIASISNNLTKEEKAKADAILGKVSKALTVADKAKLETKKALEKELADSQKALVKFETSTSKEVNLLRVKVSTETALPEEITRYNELQKQHKDLVDKIAMREKALNVFK